MNKKAVKRGLFPYLFVFLFIIIVMFVLNILNQKINIVTYDEFIKSVKEGEVETVIVTPRNRAKVYELTGVMKGYEKNETYFVRVPLAESVMNKLIGLEEKYDFQLKSDVDPESSTLLLFFVNIFPMVLILGVGFFLITRQMGSANKSMDFGKSRARLNQDNNKVTFNDVAGLEEEKEEVSELIDFLKNPKKCKI